MRGDTERGVGISLWLLPEGEARARLLARIPDLARRHGSAPFEPHVTLVAGIPLATPGWMAACERLSRETEALDVLLGAPGHADAFFRCLYLSVEPTAELVAARDRAERLLGVRRGEAPLLHLSLLYARLAKDRREMLAAELGALEGMRFTARHLDALVTEGPPGEWRRVARFPLSRRGRAAGREETRR